MIFELLDSAEGLIYLTLIGRLKTRQLLVSFALLVVGCSLLLHQLDHLSWFENQLALFPFSGRWPHFLLHGWLIPTFTMIPAALFALFKTRDYDYFTRFYRTILGFTVLFEGFELLGLSLYWIFS